MQEYVWPPGTVFSSKNISVITWGRPCSNFIAHTLQTVKLASSSFKVQHFFPSFFGNSVSMTPVQLRGRVWESKQSLKLQNALFPAEAWRTQWELLSCCRHLTEGDGRVQGQIQLIQSFLVSSMLCTEDWVQPLYRPGGGWGVRFCNWNTLPVPPS